MQRRGSSSPIASAALSCAIAAPSARRRRNLASRHGASCLIADGDEQRRDMLAVLARLGERGTRALGLNPRRSQLDFHHVRFRVRPADASDGLADVDVFDDLASGVVEPAKKCSCAKEPTQTSVA